MTQGLAKSQQIRSLCNLLDRNKIKYDVKEIQNLSIRQLRKRIKELGGGRRGLSNGRLSETNNQSGDITI